MVYDYAVTQGAGISTLVHPSGEGSSQRTSLEDVNSRRNLDGEGHQRKLDIVIHSPPST